MYNYKYLILAAELSVHTDVTIMVGKQPNCANTINSSNRLRKQQ